VVKNAPFLSRSGPKQWLTQGYYFWTDSDHFAHKWGQNSYNNSYAILECMIEVDEKLLLDLVGSTADQLYFDKMLRIYKDRLKSAGQSESATVSAVISHMRELTKDYPGTFPFAAIKAQDKLRRPEISFNGGREMMPLGIQRLQLCLFENFIHLLKSKNIVHPSDFV